MTEYYFDSERDFRDSLQFQDEYLECHLASRQRPCWTCGKPTRVGMCATCSATHDPDVTISDDDDLPFSAPLEDE